MDIACLLLEYGVEVDAEDKFGKTSYQIALDKERNEVVQLLLAPAAESGLGCRI